MQTQQEIMYLLHVQWFLMLTHWKTFVLRSCLCFISYQWLDENIACKATTAALQHLTLPTTGHKKLMKYLHPVSPQGTRSWWSTSILAPALPAEHLSVDTSAGAAHLDSVHTRNYEGFAFECKHTANNIVLQCFLRFLMQTHWTSNGVIVCSLLFNATTMENRRRKLKKLL